MDYCTIPKVLQCSFCIFVYHLWLQTPLKFSNVSTVLFHTTQVLARVIETIIYYMYYIAFSFLPIFFDEKVKFLNSRGLHK